MMNSWVRLTPGGLSPSPPPGGVVVVDGEGGRWGRCYPANSAVRLLAAREWVTTARAVAAEASARGMATAKVAGTGVLAALVTMALPVADRRTPHVIVETEGSARALTDAIARVAGLGTVVLAARPAMPDLMARTYGDLHVRGLTIVGVPWASADPAAADAPEDASEDEESVQWALGHLRLWGEQ